MPKRRNEHNSNARWDVVVEREDFVFLYPFIMTTMTMVAGVGGAGGWVVATGRRWRLRCRLKVLRELMYKYCEDR